MSDSRPISFNNFTRNFRGSCSIRHSYLVITRFISGKHGAHKPSLPLPALILIIPLLLDFLGSGFFEYSRRPIHKQIFGKVRVSSPNSGCQSLKRESGN